MSPAPLFAGEKLVKSCGPILQPVSRSALTDLQAETLLFLPIVTLEKLYVDYREMQYDSLSIARRPHRIFEPSVYPPTAEPAAIAASKTVVMHC